MSKTATEPQFRIFKTLELAHGHAKQLTRSTKIKYIATCVRQYAYLVAPEDFNPIKQGFDYPTY